MKPLLICLLVVILIMCAKEHSCENCYEKPIIPPRTIPNELITYCDIYIEDESLVRKIYTDVITKLKPSTYWIFDSIIMNGSKRYTRTYDLKNYLDMNNYSIGDTFFVRYELRWRFEPATYENIDTLIY